MAGRPPLRIGQHGKITRVDLGGGVWLARCRFRDTDGVTRRVERKGPPGDQYGLGAEDALIDSLASRRTAEGETSLDTKITALIDRHIELLEEDGRAIRTIDTYTYCAKLLAKIISGVRVGEATPARIDAAIRSMRKAHGDVLAIQAKTILKGGLHLAVMANVLATNPVRDASPIRSKQGTKGAPPLTAGQLIELLAKLQESDYCAKYDMTDPILLFVATGLRRSELLALRWTDLDTETGTLAINAKLIRRAGKGLFLVAGTKTAAGRRTLPLPSFALLMLATRRTKPFIGDREMIFPSSTGTLRDPDNFGGRWAKVREDLGFPDVTSHSFRKSLATLIDEGGFSPRVGADQLGHSRISETMDTYWSRGRVHTGVAELLERTLIATNKRRIPGSEEEETTSDVPPARLELATPALGEPCSIP